MPQGLGLVLKKLDLMLDALPDKLSARSDAIEEWATGAAQSFVGNLDVYTMLVSRMQSFDEDRSGRSNQVFQQRSAQLHKVPWRRVGLHWRPCNLQQVVSFARTCRSGTSPGRNRLPYHQGITATGAPPERCGGIAASPPALLARDSSNVVSTSAIVLGLHEACTQLTGVTKTLKVATVHAAHFLHAAALAQPFAL